MARAAADWVAREVVPRKYAWGHPPHLATGGACDSNQRAHVTTRADRCAPCTGPTATHRCWRGYTVPEGYVRGLRQAMPMFWFADRRCRIHCTCPCRPEARR